MALAAGYWIDTNILLRLSRTEDTQHELVKRALSSLDVRGEEFYISLQNVAEFWNVCTRPVERNGYGLSVIETNRRVLALEEIMEILPDNEQVYALWRQIVVDHGVQGVQVHDARLAASMRAHGVDRILTLNEPDFRRYTGIEAIHPAQV